MAISYNSTARFNEDSSSSSTTTWSHTCNASDTKLIVVVGGRSSISSVTYNGVSMTLISSQFDTYQYNAAYYLDNPPTGSAYNVVATYSSANQYRSGLSVGLSGASSGIGATGTSPTDFNVSIPKTVTSSITTTSNNSDIFTIPSANDGGSDTYITYGASQTEIYRNNAGNWAFRAQYKTTTTAGSNTTSISNNTSINNIAIMSFELKLPSPNNSNFFNFM